MSAPRKLTLQSAVNATGNGNVFNVAGFETLSVQVSGTFTATVTFEGSNDNTTWAAVQTLRLHRRRACLPPTY
jgi:hypothetical protein